MPEKQAAQAPPTEAELAAAAVDCLLQLKDHPGWNVLMARLHAEADNAKEDFAVADLTDMAKVENLQRTIQRLYWFEDTIEILINEGSNEEEALEEYIDG